ncbi:MAG: DUF2807 domain-containing protein [Bacteroidales bacterium]|nr:DUF2807 domain-containing protein [Bacteroidales bacterium]
MNIIKITRTAIAVAITALTASSCYIRISDENKKDLKEISMNHKLMSEVIYGPGDSLVYKPGEFHAIDAAIWVDIIFEQREGEPEVVVKGSTRVRDSIKVENIDGTLRIFFQNTAGGVIYTKDEYIKVYAPGLDDINKSGSGDLTVSGTLKGENLSISKSGSGDMYLERCEIQGPVTLLKTGSGDIEASVKCLSMDVDASGSGDVFLRGEATDVSLKMSGSGDMDASKLKADKVTVAKNGSGDITYMDGDVVKEL